MPYTVYILKCSDGSYYTGLTKDLEARVREHKIGAHPNAYTFNRRPIKLVWSIVIESYSETLRWERQVKGWSRAKKEALIHGDIDGIHEVVKSERVRREGNKKKTSR